MLGNVLENACRYGAGLVRVTTSASGGDKEHLHIAIEDDGPGIAADYAADVVSRGTRLDSQTTGQGIGLSWSQNCYQFMAANW